MQFPISSRQRGYRNVPGLGLTAISVRASGTSTALLVVFGGASGVANRQPLLWPAKQSNVGSLTLHTAHHGLHFRGSDGLRIWIWILGNLWSDHDVKHGI
jgi:hypothetical protein